MYTKKHTQNEVIPMQASIREMRTATKEIMQTVSRGESVIITYRGKPFAKIIRIANKGSTTKTEVTDELFGVWKDHIQMQSISQYIDHLRTGRNLFNKKHLNNGNIKFFQQRSCIITGDLQLTIRKGAESNWIVSVISQSVATAFLSS